MKNVCVINEEKLLLLWFNDTLYEKLCHMLPMRPLSCKKTTFLKEKTNNKLTISINKKIEKKQQLKQKIKQKQKLNQKIKKPKLNQELKKKQEKKLNPKIEKQKQKHKLIYKRKAKQFLLSTSTSL